MVNSLEFAKRLEKILDFYNLSATAFSEKIAFNRSTISHLLSGRNKPSLEFVMKVLETFPEVELYWLLNGKGNFPSTPKNWNTQNVIVEPEAENAQKSSKVLINETKEIDRIVIFFKDGSFKDYQ